MRSASLLAIAALFAATGCANIGGDRTAVVSSSPQSVTIRFDEGHLAAANERAQEMCDAQQGTAQLQTVTPGQGNERIAAYSCV